MLLSRFLPRRLTLDCRPRFLSTLAGAVILCSNVPAAQPPDSQTPTEPVGQTQKPSVFESDREFLRQVEAGDAPRAATPPPPVATAPSPVTPRPSAPVTARVAERPPAPETRRATASGISREAVHRFVRQFIRASEGATPDGEVALYAGRVRYFDSGVVGHETIEKDQRRYYQRWPSREFTLLDGPEMLREDAGSVTVRYRLHYDLHRGEESASGQTEHVLSLQNGDDGLKIVAIRERKPEER